MTKFQRILCAIFTITLFISCFPSSAFAAYENTYVNTGDQRADIIGVALTQVGNTNSKHKYRKDDASWCASFVVWCARQANIDASVIKNSGCANADNFGVTYKGRSADRSKTIEYTPQSGDLIIFDWSDDGYNTKTPASSHGDHVGIVQEVKDGYVYTIEGNNSNQVAQKKYPLTSEEIKGYGVPEYKKSSIRTIMSDMASKVLGYHRQINIKKIAFSSRFSRYTITTANLVSSYVLQTMLT